MTWALCGALAMAAYGVDAQAQTQQELEDQVLGTGSASSDGSVSDRAETEEGDRGGSNQVPAQALKDDLEELKLREKAKDSVREGDLEAIEEAVAGPKEIPARHILVVQRRYIQKEERHEIIPAMFGLQPADSFRKQLQWGFGYVYHMSENFGVELVHANMVTNYATGLAKKLKDPATVNLEIDRVEPVLSVGSSLQWTPLHSKAAARTSIHFFEGFFLAGGGVSKSENESSGMVMVGVGFRVYLTKHALFKAEIRDYIDFKTGGTDYRFNLLAGFGILLGDLK